jgi:lipopolysaccharide export system permease protein
MLLIDRYISGSVLTATLYAVLVLSVVLVFGNVFKEALDLLINRDVPARYLLFFMACVLPFSLTFTVPWGFLTATLLILGRMSADHETVALRACGISLVRTFLPVIAAGIVLSLFCIWLNASVNPRAELAMRRSLADMARSNPDSLFVAGEIMDDFGGKKIYIQSKNQDWLSGVTLFEENEDGMPKTIVRATHGKVGVSPDRESLVLDLWNARVELRYSEAPEDISKIRYGTSARQMTASIPFGDLAGGLLSRPLRTYTLPELMRFLSEDSSEGSQGKPPHTRTGLVTEISKRFSLGFASLAFAIVAVPLGIVAQRRETSAGFGMSLAVAFSYFAFVELAHSLRDNAAAHPYFILWIPNILALLIGGWLLLRLDRR